MFLDEGETADNIQKGYRIYDIKEKGKIVSKREMVNEKYAEIKKLQNIEVVSIA